MASETDTHEETASDDEELDTRWIEQFKNDECNYNHFYKEPNTSIMLYMLYIKDKEIIHVATNRCLLENGELTRERIISLIKHYQTREVVKYKLLSLLRYNIDLNPDEINDFVNDEINDRFMTAEKYLNNIQYKDSINMFQDLNALYFIYESTHTPEVLNHTKKIKLHTKNHKTMRNKHLKITKEIS
jgi:hypothetical protein